MISGQILGQTTPRASDDNTGTRWLQSRGIAKGIQINRRCRRAREQERLVLTRDDGIQQGLVLCQCCVDRFLDRKVEMHGARCRLSRVGIRTVGLTPGQSSKLNQGRGGHGVQPLRSTHATPTTGGTQKVLLIHGLIGAALLESERTIGGDNEQRLAGTIGFNQRRQQIRHSRSRGGHHSHASATSGSKPQRQKSSRSLVNGRFELEMTGRRQQTRCRCQRSRATPRAEHQAPQTKLDQPIQQG